MTAQEAKSALMELRPMGWVEYITEAIDMAIDALEKQVPKKPTTDEFKIFHCPNCEKEIMWDTDYGQQMTDYCADCGQAIDWSEAEEWQ